MSVKAETFTVQTQQGDRFTVEKWVQQFKALSGTSEVATYSMAETGEVLRPHPAHSLGYENVSTGELYVRID